MIAISGRRRDGKKYRKDRPLAVPVPNLIVPINTVYNTAMQAQDRQIWDLDPLNDNGMYNYFSLGDARYAYAVVFLSTKPDVAGAVDLEQHYYTSEQQVPAMMKSLGMTPTIGMNDIYTRLDSTSNTDIIALELKGHNQVNNAGLWYTQHRDVNVSLRRPPFTGAGNRRYTSVTISRLRLVSFISLGGNSWQENSPFMQLVEYKKWADLKEARGRGAFYPYAVIGNVTAPGYGPVPLHVVGIVIYKSDVANKSWDD